MESPSYLTALKQHFACVPIDSSTPELVKAHLDPIINFHKIFWRREKQVTFLGGFKAGKSTLISAIVGESLLPSRANRATGVVTRISYAPEKKATIIQRKPDGSVFKKTVNYQDVAQYILLDVSHTIATAVADIESVSIQIPLPILQNNCLLVDTPGLMDNQALTKRTYKELEKSDLAVMVLCADKLLSEVEKQAVERVNSLLNGNIIFIINRLDTVDEDEIEEIIDWAKRSLQGIGNSLVGQTSIFATQAKNALSAKQKGTKKCTKLQGLLAFEQWLEDLLNSSDSQKIMLLSRLGILESYLVQANSYFQMQLTESQKVTNSLKKIEAEQKNQQKSVLKKTSMEDRLRLSSFKVKLEQFGENFIQDCIQKADRLIDNDKEWEQKLQNSLISAAEEYVHKINQEIKSTDFKSQITIPTFNINKSSSNPQVVAAENPAEAWGFGIGIVLGIAAPGAWFVGAPIGAAVGSWLGKNFFSSEIKQKTLESVEQAARSLLPNLKSEAERYTEQIEKLLLNYLEINQQKIQSSPQLQAAEQSEQYYNHLVDWCQGFQTTVNSIKMEIIK